MKKLLIIISTIVSLSAYSATTATLLIKGIVPAILSVSVTPLPIAALLPLNTTQTGTKIATVTERSNNSAGYKISIQSQNQGKLLLDISNFIVYSLTYGGQSVNLATTQQFNYAFVSAAPVDRDVNISYNGTSLEDLKAGDYTDIVTFTISAN